MLMSSFLLSLNLLMLMPVWLYSLSLSLLQFCIFSSRLMGRGHYVFDRRWDRMRLALQSMVEKHLNAQMWRWACVFVPWDGTVWQKNVYKLYRNQKISYIYKELKYSVLFFLIPEKCHWLLRASFPSLPLVPPPSLHNKPTLPLPLPSLLLSSPPPPEPSPTLPAFLSPHPRPRCSASEIPSNTSLWLPHQEKLVTAHIKPADHPKR